MVKGLEIFRVWFKDYADQYVLIYYDFIMDGRKNLNGLPWVGEDRLIPLKALAWLSLTQEKSTGGQVDSKNIKKHLSDIVVLTTLLSPVMKISIDAKIATDLKRFIAAVNGSTPVNNEATRALDRLTTAYGLQ